LAHRSDLDRQATIFVCFCLPRSKLHASSLRVDVNQRVGNLLSLESEKKNVCCANNKCYAQELGTAVPFASENVGHVKRPAIRSTASSDCNKAGKLKNVLRGYRTSSISWNKQPHFLSFFLLCLLPRHLFCLVFRAKQTLLRTPVDSKWILEAGFRSMRGAPKSHIFFTQLIPSREAERVQVLQSGKLIQP
jgi:hypothetical protein